MANVNRITSRHIPKKEWQVQLYMFIKETTTVRATHRPGNSHSSGTPVLALSSWFAVLSPVFPILFCRSYSVLFAFFATVQFIFRGILCVVFRVTGVAVLYVKYVCCNLLSFPFFMSILPIKNQCRWIGSLDVVYSANRETRVDHHAVFVHTTKQLSMGRFKVLPICWTLPAIFDLIKTFVPYTPLPRFLILQSQVDQTSI